MGDYIIEFKYKQSNSAGSKAKIDINSFLEDAGFESINFPIYKNRVVRALTYKTVPKIILSKIKSGRVIFQYPLYNKRLANSILKELTKKTVEKLAIIHDLESLRENSENLNAIMSEINFLNQFDRVISHNSKMTNWLKKNGLKTKVNEIGIFDYDNPVPISDKKMNDGIVFAGNLEKSEFLSKINVQTKIDVMGPNPLSNYPINVEYRGVYSPEKVPIHLQSKYGLVWDGNSIETCDGLFGRYMKYNNPHKVSLYLSSGIPVIIWKDAAIAGFIKKNHVGLIVNSLNDIDEIINAISDDEYNQMRKNTLKIANKMRAGFYIKHAVQ
ncbi:hypothetical protein BSQ38_01495 [Pediococcus damnosus]|uniref:sugar transferase n=1 Tax=Pediococcus damnosus TaxID=51663 RepID=UPI000C1CA0D3|nr:sugar transferase [Pediococcus damnosus]PIO80414.1 hypothetical protein BSQ38_01495 [Pediococcus damnosus]